LWPQPISLCSQSNRDIHMTTNLLYRSLVDGSTTTADLHEGLAHMPASAPSGLKEAQWLRRFDKVKRPLPSLAKLDASAVVILGLFSSLSRDDYAGDASGEFKKRVDYRTVELTVTCGSPLGDSEQRVLRGLAAHATDEYASYSADRLYERVPVHDPELLVGVRCTLHRLAQVAGFGSPGAGETNDVIRKSLKKLADVRLRWVGPDSGTEEEALITSLGTTAGHRSVDVFFHSRLQAAILASRPGEQYYKVGMDEARSLRSPCARLLHHRLAHMNEGASTIHGMDTLESYVWPERAQKRRDQLKRHVQVVKALTQLSAAGWRFEPSEKPGCVVVVRPVVNSFRPFSAVEDSVAEESIS